MMTLTTARTTIAPSAAECGLLSDALPHELMACPQWVTWRYVPDEQRGKPRKVPASPRTGANASSTNPATWGTFDDALARFEGGDWAGVGFVFSANDPYCGIDLDKCVDAPDGELSELAAGLIEQMNSYTELSPSGTGVHIIVKARLPGKGRKTDSIEIYDRGRFFTVTGGVIGQACSVVADRQNEVDSLYRSLQRKTVARKKGPFERQARGPELPDHVVLETICATPTRHRFVALFSGNWTRLHGSQSEADLALVGILADFIGNNPQQIDRLFRGSNLFRPKWDEYRGEHTYGELTIGKALGEDL